MSSGMPLFLGPRSHRRFAIWHAARGPARAGLVLCPPWFHEYTRSYRLWALLAARLAQAGIACLRMDYYGCGDSDGDDEEFSLAGACADVVLGLRELGARLPGVPRIVCGVRAGAWPAWTAAASGAEHLWLWQPIRSGAAYLATLRRLDAQERASYVRYPWHGGAPNPAESATLMGFPCRACLPGAIAERRLDGATPSPGVRVVVLDGAAAIAHADAYAERVVVLPDSLTAWADELHMGGTWLGPEFEPVLQSLLQSLHESSRAVAWTN